MGWAVGIGLAIGLRVLWSWVGLRVPGLGAAVGGVSLLILGWVFWTFASSPYTGEIHGGLWIGGGLAVLLLLLAAALEGLGRGAPAFGTAILLRAGEAGSAGLVCLAITAARDAWARRVYSTDMVRGQAALADGDGAVTAFLITLAALWILWPLGSALFQARATPRSDAGT